MGDIGAKLRAAREAQGLSIAEVAQETRITEQFIEALEAEEFEAIPAPVYVRGFLRSYANYLQIDPQPLLNALPGNALASQEPVVETPAAPATPAGPFASAPRPRGAYEPVPQAPAPSLADPGDQWWPEAGNPDDRGLWPGLAPRQAADVQAAATSAASAAPAVGREPAAEAPTPAAPVASSAQSVAYEHERLRRLRETGILVEQDEPMDRGRGGGAGGIGGASVRTLAIVGGAVFGLVALIFAAFAMSGGGGDGPSGLAAADDEPTATREGGQVIAVGTSTPRVSVTPKPSTTPNPKTPTTTPEPSSTAGPSETPKPSATKVPTTPGGGGSGSSDEEDEPTPKPPPSNTPKPPATNTPVPPTNTPTPKPPTPAPTAVVHPIGYAECTTTSQGSINCPGQPPYLVVCGPNGWFVDIAPYYPKPASWPSGSANTPYEARFVCG